MKTNTSITAFMAEQLINASPLSVTDERIHIAEKLIKSAHKAADNIGAEGKDNLSGITYSSDDFSAMCVADWLAVSLAKALGFAPTSSFKESVRRQYVTQLSLEIGLHKNVKPVYSY